MAESTPDRVLRYIYEHPGSLAQDIARALGVEKKKVNSALYGDLSAEVEADAAFRWYPTGSVPDSEDPACPDCDAPMALRTARKGPNAGNQFWGCSRYPECKGIRSVEGYAGGRGNEASLRSAGGAGSRARVAWSDGFSNNSWHRTYTIGGGGLRSAPGLLADKPSWRMSQLFLGISRQSGMGERDDQIDQVIGTVRKIIQRGDRPLLDPQAERDLVQSSCSMTPLASWDPGDLSFEIEIDQVTAEDIDRAFAWSEPDFQMGVVVPFDSAEEAALFRWILQAGGASVARWVTPQAPLDLLLAGAGQKGEGQRRVDFLYAPPGSEPLIIEVDGVQHERGAAVDADRDTALRKAGIRVLRIPASEIRAGTGDGLRQLGEMLRRPEAVPSPKALRLVYGPWIGSALALALLEAVERGWLPLADTWHLAVTESLGLAERLLPPVLELLAAVDELWAGYLAPTRVVVDQQESRLTFERVGVAHYRKVSSELAGPGPQVHLVLEPGRSPMDEMPEARLPTVVARSSTVPVFMADRRQEGTGMAPPRDDNAVPEALQRVLQFVFAKKEFREGQEQAVLQILNQRDCLVLLPTGAGKSLIYQLAGLLMPGRTLIVDPIVALLEDQLLSMRRYGIDRAVGLSSFLRKTGGMERALAAVKTGDALFFYVAPERLQMPEFRAALRELTVNVPVNLAVVDEAHCISEWGHEFRLAYLNLGATIREWCEGPSGRPPPILGLTGTASRAVLRDVLFELGIDQGDPNAIIKPETFNRTELRFEIVRARPGEGHSRLRGYLRGLPQRFGVSFGEFYAPPGRSPYLGIVFCPFVNNEYGIMSVARALRDGLLTNAGVYGGSTVPNEMKDRKDEWEELKRRNAEAFRKGEVSVLVTTKAFGMGIDVPNIRFTAHHGIPGSIEAFYQEAGRAGRDRQQSLCSVVFTDADPVLTRRMLSDDTDEEAVRALYESIKKSQQDDVVRQLYFHFKAFKGRDAELGAVEGILAELGWRGEPTQSELPFGQPKEVEQRERAIHRLTVVGVVADYLKDYGSKRFIVKARRASPHELTARFLDYVGRSQPGRLEQVAAATQRFPETSLQGHVLALAHLAVDLLYDTIERSRRRSLREMWLLANESEGDADIRRRVEDYFHEGELAPIVQDLVDTTPLDLSAWQTLLGPLAPADEGELRGTTARFLESYPDHPGLLVARAFAEILSGVSIDEAAANLLNAIESGLSRYLLQWPQVAGFFSFLLLKTRQLRPEWCHMIWTVWARSAGPSSLLDAAAVTGLADARAHHTELLVLLQRRLAGPVSESVDLLLEHAGIVR